MIETLTAAQWVAGLILVLTFLGIFTEHYHGVERAKFAMAGAGGIIVAGQWLGFYSPELALEAIDWNVIFLLGLMMVLVAIMVSTGGFEVLAGKMAAKAGASQFRLMALMGSAVMFLSMLLDNVTTVVIFGPLIVIVCQRMKVSPVPHLLAAAMLSNIGGIATLVGDPPNLMIGSAADINFNTFLIHMGPPALLCWGAGLVAFRLIFKNELAVSPAADSGEIPPYRYRGLWRKSLCVLGLMVVLFVVHGKLHWEPWMVAAAGLTLLLFVSRHAELEPATGHIESSLLMFFISLFIVIRGVEHSGLLGVVGEAFRPIVEGQPLLAALILLWSAAILSALIDNIPFTAAMIPVLLSLQLEGVNVNLMWWSLALGVGLGGNATHIGATANVYVVTISERLARESGNPDVAITPAVWARKGLPAATVTLIVASLFIIAAQSFLS